MLNPIFGAISKVSRVLSHCMNDLSDGYFVPLSIFILVIRVIYRFLGLIPHDNAYSSNDSK